MNLNQPLDSLTTPRFAGISTFYRLPTTDSSTGLDAALFGVPFDGGQSYRTGSRFAPAEVRRMSSTVKPYNPSLAVGVYDYLNVADLGDSPVNPLDPDRSRELIEMWGDGVVGAGAMPVAIGGDHSIALPLLRAAHRKHGPLALIQVDSHLDTTDSYFGTPYGGGTPFRRAVEEGLIEPSKWFQVGIRGPVYAEDEYAFVEEHGVHCMTMDRIAEHGFDWAIEEVAAIGDTPCYVTFDIDGIDPAFAPGTTAPVSGGFTSREAIDLVRSLVKLPNIVGFDMVEVQPQFDVGSVTSILAALITWEFLGTRAVVRRNGS